MGKRRVLDSDGAEVTAGCTIHFAYGIPPVSVRAPVIDRDGVLIALTPGHNPAEAPVSTFKLCFIEFWVEKGSGDVEDT